MKTENFKIKAKELEFFDVNSMSKDDKNKVYKDFVKFLNNHFKRTAFSKNLYKYLHLKCNFIAHYNIDGFYGEYFGVPMAFHKKKSNYMPTSEYIGFTRTNELKTVEDTFTDILRDIFTNSSDGLSLFFSNIFANNYNSDYSDLNRALKDVYDDYISCFYEVQNAAVEKKNKQENKIIEDVVCASDFYENEKETHESKITYNKISQTSLFDFI